MHCSNKAMTHKKRRQKLQKTYEETKGAYGAGVYYCDRKKRLVKYTCNCKELRQSLNRKVRRRMNRMVSEDEGTAPVGYYRKMADYWWELL